MGNHVGSAVNGRVEWHTSMPTLLYLADNKTSLLPNTIVFATDGWLKDDNGDYVYIHAPGIVARYVMSCIQHFLLIDVCTRSKNNS